MLRALPTSPLRVWCLCTPGMGFRRSQGKLQIISSASTEAQKLWLPRPHNRGAVGPLGPRTRLYSLWRVPFGLGSFTSGLLWGGCSGWLRADLRIRQRRGGSRKREPQRV